MNKEWLKNELKEIVICENYLREATNETIPKVINLFKDIPLKKRIRAKNKYTLLKKYEEPLKNLLREIRKRYNHLDLGIYHSIYFCDLWINFKIYSPTTRNFYIKTIAVLNMNDEGELNEIVEFNKQEKLDYEEVLKKVLKYEEAKKNLEKYRDEIPFEIRDELYKYESY